MASSAEQETRLCGNCKRDIPVDNFTIHEIHCRRNISICNSCKEPIPISDMEDHYASEHAQVTCKCNEPMEKCELEEHEKSYCPLRLVQCQFCELEVTYSTLENHEDYCGARTEQCEKCHSSVMIKDLKDHPTVCGNVKPPKKPARVQSWANNRGYEVPMLGALNSGISFVESIYSQRIPGRFHKSSLSQSKNDDLNQNSRREQNRGRERSNLGLGIDFPLDYLNYRSVERPKIFRNDDYSHPQSHQNTTRSSPEHDGPLGENNDDFWHDFYCKDNKMKANVHERSNLNYFSSNEPTPLNTPSTSTADAIQLPCEFCEELFPEEHLILHQSGCRPNVFSSFRRRSPSPPPDYIENLRPSPPADSPQSVLIPCEFCGVLMEGDILFHHQDQCDMGPNAEKTAQFSAPSVADHVYPDVSSEDRSYRGPASSSLQSRRTGSDTTVATRGYADNTTRDDGRINSLYRKTSTTRHSNLEAIRQSNIEENSRMMQSEYFHGHAPGASNSDNSARNKPKKKTNTSSDDVDKEE